VGFEHKLYAPLAPKVSQMPHFRVAKKDSSRLSGLIFLLGSAPNAAAFPHEKIS
jgi:hypothetical protein